ncbi:MAG TPA: hypothetical protein VFH06_03310 [Candidatus Saccharimonadales bacterium]|nr:hypothetical protein [Candidatus Saccharimonadales bacterium]
MERLNNVNSKTRFDNTDEDPHTDTRPSEASTIDMVALQALTRVNIPASPQETAFESLVATDPVISRRSSVVGTGEAQRSDFDADFD